MLYTCKAPCYIYRAHDMLDNSKYHNRGDSFLEVLFPRNCRSSMFHIHCHLKFLLWVKHAIVVFLRLGAKLQVFWIAVSVSVCCTIIYFRANHCAEYIWSAPTVSESLFRRSSIAFLSCFSILLFYLAFHDEFDRTNDCVSNCYKSVS